MYGYIVVNKPELKFREYDVYRSYYCGLCSELQKRHGPASRFALSYDGTFLVVLLTGLYEPKTQLEHKRCIAHPMISLPKRRNAVTAYAADMNVLLAYYKAADDWNDERKVSRRALERLLAGRVPLIERLYPEKTQAIREQMHQLRLLEKAGERNIDKVSACFGNIMSEVLAYRRDEWEAGLRSMGSALGRFIYIMDAYDDMEQDMQKGCYNVLLLHRDMQGFDSYCETLLNSLMASCARSFERLPVVQDAELLRNILYSGVWSRFERIREQKADRKK